MAINVALALILTCLSVPPATQDEKSAQERQRKEALAVMAPAKAKALSLAEVTARPVASVLHPTPLLRWSNAIAGSVYGEVFLWTVDDRPVASASIYRWYDPYKDSTVEITSLTNSPLELSEEGRLVWKSPANGVSFTKVAQVAAPSETRGARLRQMRDIARRFAAHLADDRGGETVHRNLRLLDQPLHRYRSDKTHVVDGALFVFAENTDPEVLLMVEAVTENGQSHWRYAVARMNAHGLDVRLDKTIIQKWDRVHDPAKDPRSTYAFFNFDPDKVKVAGPATTAP